MFHQTVTTWDQWSFKLKFSLHSNYIYEDVNVSNIVITVNMTLKGDSWLYYFSVYYRIAQRCIIHRQTFFVHSECWPNFESAKSVNLAYNQMFGHVISPNADFVLASSSPDVPFLYFFLWGFSKQSTIKIAL